jgi:hypothetical protein
MASLLLLTARADEMLRRFEACDDLGFLLGDFRGDVPVREELVLLRVRVGSLKIKSIDGGLGDLLVDDRIGSMSLLRRTVVFV